MKTSLNKTFLDTYRSNSRQNIEDPIFTGFTLEIDEEHSPLFFNGMAYSTSDTLRSADGSDSSLAEKIENNLKAINQEITFGQYTYGINTINAKDPFGTSNERRPGYGLWEYYDIDEIPYGAVDYIYMVDKPKEGQFGGDRLGVTDLGNGSPNKSVLDEYEKATSKYENIEDLNVYFDQDKYEIKSDYEKKLKDFAETVKKGNGGEGWDVCLAGYASLEGEDEHNKKLSENRVNAVKKKLVEFGLEDLKVKTSHYGETDKFAQGNKESKLKQNRVVVCKVGSTIEYEIEKRTQELKEDDLAEIDHTYNTAVAYGLFNSKLEVDEDIKEKQKKNEKIDYSKYGSYGEYLKASSEDSNYGKAVKAVEDKENEIAESKTLTSQFNNLQAEIAELFKKFKENTNKSEWKKALEDKKKEFDEFIEKLKSNKSIDYKIDLKKEVDEKIIKEVDGMKPEELGDDTYKEICRKALAVINSKLTKLETSKKAEEELNKLKEEREKVSTELYGKHKDGTPGTEENPADGSLCWNYLNDAENCNNDLYSEQQNEIDRLKSIQENQETIDAYSDYQQSRATDVTSVLQSTDNETTGDEKDNPSKRVQLKEVPQTVYDILGFVSGMHELTNNKPYVFQTVTGLDEAYKNYFEIKDPYMGSGENKISIECLEFLDLSVSSMFNKYFNAVYDRRYRRERVPINLRRFKCSIFVHDIRNFRDSIDIPDVLTGDLSSIAKFAINHISAIEFKFFDCEIVPSETGSIFETVSDNSAGDMRNTKFTFTYGNCVINFLPFEDLRKYVIEKEVRDIRPGESISTRSLEEMARDTSWDSVLKSKNADDGTFNQNEDVDDGNFRRWYDRSILGNVNNNDYRDYIRRDSFVAVDDHFKTTIVNNFALGSVSNKNKELTELDDALRRIVLGISASTGIPVKGVTDSLNIGFIDPILNEKDLATPVIKDLGNVTNSRVVTKDTMEYMGEVVGEEDYKPQLLIDLGNVNDEEGGN